MELPDPADEPAAGRHPCRPAGVQVGIVVDRRVDGHGVAEPPADELEDALRVAQIERARRQVPGRGQRRSGQAKPRRHHSCVGGVPVAP